MTVQLSHTEKLEIAMIVVGILKSEQKVEKLPADYVPTKRLTVNQACEHLGISRSTLYERCRSGEVRRHFTAGNRPYFLLGELDGVAMPEVGSRKGVRNVKV